MKEVIVKKLRQIEKENNVNILFAVESGSRAWGFESPDSDYDVRFIYVRPEEEYLKLKTKRDVIELPIDEKLDINGWDLKKTLNLLYKSNPTLFEWFSSPIVYKETDFANRFRRIMLDYYNSKKCLYHYICMAKNNYCEFLTGETVKVKKYFYVLRPVLACRWILENGTPPPMKFSVLAMAELPEYLHSEIEKLLDLKIKSPETKTVKKVEILNEYLRINIEDIKNEILQLPETFNYNWEHLDELFLHTVQTHN